jgi:hypothetical protein
MSLYKTRIVKYTTLELMHNPIFFNITNNNIIDIADASMYNDKVQQICEHNTCLIQHDYNTSLRNLISQDKFYNINIIQDYLSIYFDIFNDIGIKNVSLNFYQILNCRSTKNSINLIRFWIKYGNTDKTIDTFIMLKNSHNLEKYKSVITEF